MKKPAKGFRPGTPYKPGTHGKHVQTYLDKATAHQLNLVAYLTRKSITDIVTEALKAYIEQTLTNKGVNK